MSLLSDPLWTSDAIAAATGGTASAPFRVTGVTFDSREVIGGELFVALRGETTDGHRFVENAIQAGAAGALVSERVDAPNVRVADTFAGLTALARAARARTAATVVGVTGSVGKTGVKEALRLAFERIAPGATHASVKSYNNHTGVPLSLARMPAATRYGVFEMGMNHAGELTELSALVRPHIAVVTAVASAHRAFFASEEAIADAKGEIFSGLEPGGAAVLPFDSLHCKRLLDAVPPHARVLTFGERRGADVRPLSAEFRSDSTSVIADVLGTQVHFTIAQAGRHWLSNALAVLAVVHAAGGDLTAAGVALGEMPGLEGRGRRLTVATPTGDATVIDESYNANPASMAAALQVLSAIDVGENGRKLAVLGEMRELGEASATLHAGLADHVVSAGVSEAVLVGSEMGPLAEALDGRVDVIAVGDATDAIAHARKVLGGGDVLLVKGSNGVGLARLVRALREAPVEAEAL